MGNRRGKRNCNINAKGGFAGIPRIVMDSQDYQSLSFKAKALLLELACQYKGANNGNLTVAFTILKRRGWKREATIWTATQELLSVNLIVRTRQGQFLNPGGRCALYALTWQPIDECPGKELETESSILPPRKFSLERFELTKNPLLKK
jgi:hypothetical protein